MLWHKENLINMGVARLLPSDWQSFAWIDAEVEFLEPTWAQDALNKLRTHDVIQLFSHALDMDARGNTMSAFQAAAIRL